MKCDFCGTETTRGIIGIGAVCQNPLCEAQAIVEQKNLEHDQLMTCPCGYTGWKRGYLPFSNCPQCNEFLFLSSTI